MTLTSYAQKSENEEVYLKALDHYIIELDSLLTNNKNSKREKTIYLEVPDFIKEVPDTVNGYRIIVLTQDNIKQIYKSKDNVLTHTKMFPLMIEDGKVKVSFIPYAGTRKRGGNLNLSYGGGTSIFFKYDCQKEHFKYDRSHSWGI